MKYIFTLLFLYINIISYAQSDIFGKVIDKNTGEPIIGAHVIAYPSQKIAITNFDGSYTVKNLDLSDTTLKVTMVGFKDISKKIVRGQQQLNFELEESVQDFSEVVVTGTRTLKTLGNTPVLTKLITAKQIETSGASSALDALEFSLPGVNFSRNPHNISMEIQGLGNRYILVLLDGQRMTGETLDQVNMSRINADDIQKIEVLSGAASALYGSNAIGSVVNIITKRNTRKWQGNIGVKYGYENKDLTNDIAVGYKNKDLDVRFSGFRRSSDGYNLQPEKNNATQPAYIDYSGKLSAAYDLSKYIRLKAEGAYFRNDNESGDPNVSGHKLRENYTYGLGLELRPSAKHLLEIKAHSDDSKQSYTNLGKNPDEVFGKNTFGTISFLDTYTHSQDLQVVLGADYNKESVFSLTTFGSTPSTKKITDFNAYLQADYKIIPTLNLVAGLRYTQHETFGSHYTPKFTLMQTVGNFKFRGNLSWGYKAPSLKHLYYNFFMAQMFWIYGNPDLKPETSFYNSFSVEYAKKDFNISVNLFKNKLKDKIDGYFAIDSKTGKRSYYYKNYSSVRIKGIEAFMNLRFLQNFTTQIGYNLLDTRDMTTNRQIPGVSKHSGTFGLTWSNSKIKYPISFNVSARVHSDRQFFKEEKGATSGNVVLKEDNEQGFAMWKATYSQEFKLYSAYRLQVKIGVDNITDYKKNETVINPGRTFWGALRIYL